MSVLSSACSSIGVPTLALICSVVVASALGSCKAQPLDSSPDAAADTALPASSVPTTRPQPPMLDAGDAIDCDSKDALDLYEQKIAPLFADDRPSTCSQCHLPGVDLGMYVRDTPCETLACMTEQQLIDPRSPKDSLIIQQIGRAQPDSELITAEVIAGEKAAFEQWITFNVQCGTCAGSVCSKGDGGATCNPERPPGSTFDPADIDPGGCEDEALEEVFRQTVYASRGRCSPCHFNDHLGEEAPQWIEVGFACEESAQRTLRNVISRRYVNVEAPELSLLLRKPLGEANGGLEHGGGTKFAGTSDPGYRVFEYFVERYAACQRR